MNVQENQLFQMKFTSKQLVRMHVKCDKQEKDEVPRMFADCSRASSFDFAPVVILEPAINSIRSLLLTQKLKIKKAMEKGDAETARIYAQNAIRIKNTGNNYLRLASRLDAVRRLA